MKGGFSRLRGLIIRGRQVSGAGGTTYIAEAQLEGQEAQHQAQDVGQVQEAQHQA